MKETKLSVANIDKLEYVYDLDSDVVLNNKTFESKEGLRLAVFDALSSANDTKINNFSNLVLSKKIPHSNIGYIKTNKKGNYPETFTSYLIANAQLPLGANTSSRMLAVNPQQLGLTNKSIDTCDLILNEYSLSANNENYFEITFIDELDCTITHFDNYKTLYLTWTGSGFNFQTKDTTGTSQIFSYILDKPNGYMSLYKRYDVNPAKILKYNSGVIVAATPDTRAVPVEFHSLLKVRTVPRQNKTIQLDTKWFSYKSTANEGDLFINDTRSYDQVSNNVLLNSEYENISGTSLPINFTLLKNQLTPEYEQSRNNPFPNLQDTDLREYHKIFSGSNQIEGNDKISLSFEGYTKRIELAAGKVTYFHMPQDIYPYEKINVNDAGLIDSGAIGSNSPLHSDKIFKARGGYPTSSNFGDSTEEQSGTFLCSWLAYVDSLSSYHWVDRYYNSEKLSEFEAIQASSPLTYTDSFSSIDTTLNTDNLPVYDISSNLIIEAGSLYAYHRLGPNDIKNSINSIPDNIQLGLTEYKDTNGNSLSANIDSNGSLNYEFNGKRKGKTTPAEDIKKSNNFTISFHMHSDDWSKPFGYQIFGNYITNGFGIFNKQAVTPFLTIPDTDKTYIFNSDFTLLNTLTAGADKVLRQTALDDIYPVKFGDKMYRYDLNAALKKTYGVYQSTDLFMHASSAFELWGTYGWGLVRDIQTNGQGLLKPFIAPTSTIGITDPAEYTISTDGNVLNANNFLLGAQSIAVNDNAAYIGRGYMRDVDIYGNIWKEFDEYAEAASGLSMDYLIQTDKKSNNLLASIRGLPHSINAFKTDIRGDIWVLHNNSTITKYSNNRNLIFSKPLSSLSASLSASSLSGHKTMDFIREFDSEGLKEYCIVLEQLYTSYSPVSTETTCYYLNLSGDFVKQVQLPVNLTQSVSSNNLGGISNYDYVKREYHDEINKNELIFKYKLTNPFSYKDQHEDQISYNVSDLDPGSHHFTYVADSNTSDFKLYIDGELYQQNSLNTDNLYRLDDTISRAFTVGSSPFYNGSYLSDVLNQPNYYNGINFKLKDINIYNRALNVFDIKNLFISNKNIVNMGWDVPSGKRGYIETIERFFKNRLPGHATNFYETMIHAPSSLSAQNLADSYTAQINKDLKSFAPINNKQIKSTWFYNLSS